MASTVQPRHERQVRTWCSSKAAKPYQSNILLNDSTTVVCRATDGTSWSYPAASKFIMGKAAAEAK